MAEFTVVVARSAEKELARLGDPLLSRLLSKLDVLTDDPRPHGCRKLTGSADTWRIRVGDYRIVYSIDDRRRIVDVIAIRHRSDAYR